jgi:hypothetical protein
VSGNMDDIDKQMAAIDKAMSDMPATPEAPAVPARTKRITPATLPEGGRREVVGVWARLVLVSMLAVGLTVWPYMYTCGFGLAAYLAAIGVTIGTGAWTAVSTWRLRLGVPHVLALLVTLAGLGLMANEIASRIGYAAAGQTWFCP